MVEVYLGMSDHSIVTAVINVKAKRNIQPLRKVFVYKKMNTNGLRSDMPDLQQTFLVNNERSANENTDQINQMVVQYVPQKTIKPRWDFPWLTPSMKRLIRKKQRVYNAYKNTNQIYYGISSKNLRKTVHKEMSKAKHEYLKYQAWQLWSCNPQCRGVEISSGKKESPRH